MKITFLPTTGVYSTRTLTVSFNDGSGSTINLTRPIEGTGQMPALLTISDPPTYDYGSQVLATVTSHSFTVTNSGSASATAMAGAALAAPYSYKGGTYPGTGGTCSTTLAGSATCTIIVNFTPSSAAVANATLSLSHNTGVAVTNATRPMTGTGVNAPASLSVTTPIADPYDFGTITIGAAAVDASIIVSNSGGQSATSMSVSGLSAPFNFKGGAYPGTGGDCGASLATSTTCTIVVTYLPTTPGLASNTLDLSYDDGTASTIHLTHAIRGTGGTLASLSISDGPTYDFGARTVSTTTEYTFTVTNGGGSSATSMASAALVSPFSYKGGTYPGTGGSCNTTLGAGATCTIVVTFVPGATGGFADTITLSYNDGVSSVNSTRFLTGTGGAVANLSISDGATYNYGAVVKGYSATKIFTVTNVGSATATAITGSALAAPYSYLGGTFPGTGGSCTTSLGVAGTCTVYVKYAPTTTATSPATLTLSYNDTSGVVNATRDLTGSGATITKIAGGTSHTCALYSTGVVKCWGSNFYGQLGDASNSDSSVPVAVSGIVGATDLALGANHSCAMLSNGRVYCWGADNAGQLGDSVALSNKNTSTQVALYTDFTQISAGGDITCGRRSGGTITCWGDDSEGANGNDAGFSSNATPVTVSGLTSMVSVAVGRGHACGADSGGNFRCWGSDSFGQIGSAGAGNAGVPYDPGIATSSTPVAGGDTTCDVLGDGSVQCFGADDFGQLGDGLPMTSVNTAGAVANLANFTDLKLGLKHGCALNASNAVACWGKDQSGQLGDDGSTVDQAAPVLATGMANATTVGVGEQHSCGVLSTGLAYCWGANASGQLGDGSGPTNQPTPVLVQGL
jgi:alpha-tubulin suppressor-like RCC1 family protein